MRGSLLPRRGRRQSDRLDNFGMGAEVSTEPDLMRDVLHLFVICPFSASPSNCSISVHRAHPCRRWPLGGRAALSTRLRATTQSRGNGWPLGVSFDCRWRVRECGVGLGPRMEVNRVSRRAAFAVDRRPARVASPHTSSGRPAARLRVRLTSSAQLWTREKFANALQCGHESRGMEPRLRAEGDDGA